MPRKYFCAHCDKEFVPDETGAKPRCPHCMRKGGVEPVQEAPAKAGGGRTWFLVAGLVLVTAAVGFGVYHATRVTLEPRPPLRPLEARELSAYLERDQVRVGAYESMIVLPNEVGGWPESPADIAERMRGKSSGWSLEAPLPREVLGADQTLAMIGGQEERVKLYPLELATAMAALLRQRGVRAMVAEVWEFDGAQAPADPSGILGYFVTAVYEGSQAEEPSAYFDPWGGRGEVSPSSVRVLRDTEVLAAALGIEAARELARSGDGQKALPMVEAGLSLDPVSPSLRVVHGSVLVESGGIPQAARELEAAIQLRADGPRRLNLVQLHLAQAGMLEANGEQAAAEAQFAEGHRMVAEILERWPRYGRAHLTLASIFLGLDEPERARVELETAESLSREAPMLWMIWAQYHLATNDTAAASAKMRRAVELDPDNWQLRIQAARIFQGAGDEDAARENVAAALQRVPAEKRSEIRRYLEHTMGPGILSEGAAPTVVGETKDGIELPEPALGGAAQAGGSPSGDPALMLGDPSKLRLRDPDQSLQLDLDE